MKHIWTILCQNSSVDSNTNLLSIFNCVEELTLTMDKSKAPKTEELVIPTSMHLISFWTAEETNKDNILEINAEMLDPDGKLLGKFDQEFQVKKGMERFRAIMNIQGIKITKQGRYTINMKQKEGSEKVFKIVAELPLDIKIAYMAGTRKLRHSF